MLVPRSLSRTKILVLLVLLAVAVGIGVYLVVVNLGGSVSLPTLPTTTAQFGGTIDTRLILPDPAQVADPSLFDEAVAKQLQDDGTLPIRGGQLKNADPFAPLPGISIKKK